MRYGRTLLAGLGWAGTLGGLALCVLIFLSAYLAFDDDRPGVKSREDSVIRLPSVPEAEVPRVPLARPSRRGSAADGGGGGAPTSAATPLPRSTPRTTAPVQTTPRAPVGASLPPPIELATPAPAAANPRAGSARPASPPSRPKLGDPTRGVVGAVGTEVGQVSPPVGQVIEGTGDTLGDAVDTLTRRRR